MPIYEFKCGNCGKIFEELVKDNKALENLSCIYCQSKSIKKIVSGFSIGKTGREENTIESFSSSKCGSCTTRSCSSCGI